MTLQETIHLDHNDSVSSAEWDLLETIPKGYGRARLGPEHRIFLVSMFHQLHCLRSMEGTLGRKERSKDDAEHYGHCLNYLRQTLLCDANTSLEDGDSLAATGRVHDTMVCDDWEKVYEMMDQNAEIYEMWRNHLTQGTLEGGKRDN